MDKLDGKIALITGGSEGIGLATAKRFIAEGAEHVFITGRRLEVLDAAIKHIGAKNVAAVQGDTSNLSDLGKLHDIIKEEKGRLDQRPAGRRFFRPVPSRVPRDRLFER